MGNRTLIQIHTTAIIKGLYERAMSLKTLDHKVTKGELRERFVSEILEQFLTDQFGIGTGVVINQAGLQSPQNDIVIYDKRILPPLIKNKHLGVYPIESVLALIEVKSNLRLKDIMHTEDKYRYVRETICHSQHSIYKYKDIKTGVYRNNVYQPLCALFGFYGNSTTELKNQSGEKWLNDNVKHIFAICLMQEYSWVHLKKWKYSASDPVTFEETKRFIAIILDNIRTKSIREPYLLKGEHKDWLSVYIRDQTGIKNYFNQSNEDNI